MWIQEVLTSILFYHAIKHMLVPSCSNAIYWNLSLLSWRWIFYRISRSRVLDKLIIIESKIPHILWNIKECYPFHNSLPIFRLVSSQMNPAHIINTCSWSILTLSSVLYTTPHSTALHLGSHSHLFLADFSA
jgi:hypothetical protein